jgi:hypothetical protein
MGDGVMSIRNNLDPQWKDEGYYQRNRDCGQTFTATKDCYLDAIIMRTSNSSKAVFANAIGQPMFVQLLEISGTPTINDNGTPYGTEPTHGFGVGQGMHRCDDFIEGITFTSVAVAHGGLFPDIPPTYPTGDEGKLVYIRCDLTGQDEIRLEDGKRYAFMVGFTNPTDFGPLYEDQCRIGVSMENYAAAIEPPDLTVDLTPYKGGNSVRREGDNTLPPVMIPGTEPQPQLLGQSIFPDGDARYEIPPSSDGYPDVDTYRDWNFYVEVKDNLDDVQILDGWRSGGTHAPVTGTNRALVVIVTVETDVTPPVLGSVAYGHQTLTEVVTETIVDGATVEFAAAYVLPDAGITSASDSTIALTWTTAPTKAPTVLSCLYEHVNQTSPVGATQTNSGTTASLQSGSLANSAGDKVLAAIINGSAQAGFAFSGDFSELLEEGGEGATSAVAETAGPGSPANTAVTITNGNRSALIACVLQKAATTGGARPAAPGGPHGQLRVRSVKGRLVIENAPAGPLRVSTHELSGRTIASAELSNSRTLPWPSSAGVCAVRVSTGNSTQTFAPVCVSR